MHTLSLGQSRQKKAARLDRLIFRIVGSALLTGIWSVAIAAPPPNAGNPPPGAPSSPQAPAARAPAIRRPPAPPVKANEAYGPVLRVSSFIPEFVVGSPTGQQVMTTSVRVAGPAIDRKEKTDRDPHVLSADDVLDTYVFLAQSQGTYIPTGGEHTTGYGDHLRDFSRPSPLQYRAAAIKSIAQHIIQHLNDLGFIAVEVYPDPTQIDSQTGKDLRAPVDRDLRLIINLGVATEVRTIGSGDRKSVEGKVNAPEHARIRYGSPVWPAETSAQEVRKDLIRKDEIDDYVYFLNRYPGRRVDVAVSQGQVPGGVVLDYLVSEAKPWTFYAQTSNTGTKETDTWRERFGFVDNQLTGNDDQLSIDYTTAGFSSTSQALVGSYEAPLLHWDHVRWRGYGSYSAFEASDVGLTHANFNGQETQFGGELALNFFQHRDFFADVFGGARFEHIHNNQPGVATTATADVYVPYVGLRADRTTDTSAFSASVTTNFAATSTDPARLAGLGRQNVDDDWSTLEGNVSYSFFLEPVFNPNTFQTLAHEVAFIGRGQTSFGQRVIPEHLETAGGLYTVRGYPESIISGDDVIMGTAEYRFHIPRALGIQPTSTLLGGNFRYAPDRPFGRPDWDLVFKGFCDAARVINHDHLSFEHNATLIGVGVGLELDFKQNVNIQAYWGQALTDISGLVDEGNRFHFVFTVLY